MELKTAILCGIILTVSAKCNAKSGLKCAKRGRRREFKTLVLEVPDEGIGERLFDSEIHLDVGPNRHRIVVRANGWLEPPISYGLYCLFVQTVT